MFCEKCGKPVDGEQTLCSECAAEQSAPVTEVVEQEPVVCDTFELNTVESTPEKKSPKKKGGLIAGIVALVVVAAAAIGIVCNLGSIRGFIARTFQSPEDYLVNVESDAIADFSADLTKEYGKILANYDEKQTAGQAELRLTLGDEILSLVESALQQEGMTMDVDWLKEIKLSMYANMQEDAIQSTLGLGLGSKDLLSADVIMDMDEGYGYVAVPELNDAYLSVDMSYAYSPEEFKEMISQSMQMSSDLVEDLPSEEELKELIDTYTGIILSNIDNVEKENDTITVAGVSQKVVVLTAKIKEADLLDMAEDVLKKAEKDKTIKKFLEAFGDYANQMGEMSDPYYYEAVDLYQQFADAIPYALENIEEARENADSSNYLKLKVYVDMKNQVRGHELAVYTDGEKDGETISWLTVVEGDVTYTEAELGQVQIDGEKTQKKDVSEGSYTLTVEDRKMGTLEFEDVTDTSGTLRLIPSEEIMNEALYGSGIPASLLADNVALELSYSTQEDKVSYELGVLVGTKTLLGLDLSSEPAKGGDISIPTDALSTESETDVMQWVKDAKFDEVLNALEDAGVSKDLVDAARSYVEMLTYYMN